MTMPDDAYQDLLDAEADAEGEVRVAELRLQEARSAEAPESVVAAAEEQLAAATRRLQRRRNATVLHDADADYSERMTPARADQPMQYTNSSDWLEQYLLRLWRRQNARWCSKWYLHAEALTRVEALWRSWEAMRYDGPTGMAIWWRDFLDPHMRELTAKTGPFEACNAKTGEHQQIDMLIVDHPPSWAPTPPRLVRPDD